MAEVDGDGRGGDLADEFSCRIEPVQVVADADQKHQGDNQQKRQGRCETRGEKQGRRDKAGVERRAAQGRRRARVPAIFFRQRDTTPARRETSHRRHVTYT